MDRKKARMTDDPGNSSQAATIHRTQGLRAAGEVRILGRWKYFERYSEKGRVPVVSTQSSFIRASGNSERCNMTGNEHNVGFLATGSGVKQFQLSLGGRFVLERRRFSTELRITKHTVICELRLLSNSNQAHCGPQDPPVRLDGLSAATRN
jgi:hypothetical protein